MPTRDHASPVAGVTGPKNILERSNSRRAPQQIQYFAEAYDRGFLEYPLDGKFLQGVAEVFLLNSGLTR